jgi:predicted Rossmann-fold nucleotide-binding protein
MRKAIIGVMGGKLEDAALNREQIAAARQIGSAVADSRQILLTGGVIGDPKTEFVHEAAMHEASLNAEARLIGILPVGGHPPFVPAGGAKGFYYRTGMTSKVRDSITGATADVLIFLKGGGGTLCELAYAVAAGRATYFAGSRDFLLGALDAEAEDLELTLEAAAKRCPQINGQEFTAAALRTLLETRLKSAQDWPGTLADLVDTAVKTAQAAWTPETGFPIAIGKNEKQAFEQAVASLK